MENFLNTTLRNVAWFKSAYDRKELEMKPPFQRNPVWVTRQKSFLIDTILNRYPIPEIYMQETTDSCGNTKYIIVDGQQRIRSVIEYISGKFAIDEKESPSFNGATFEHLTEDQKRSFFQYNFVVRILPDISDSELREIFQRLNRNVVALNKQELRQATYSGNFIKLMNALSDRDVFSKIGLFTPNDVRRMLDVEYISEISIAVLNGIQNKKDKLESYYMLYEETFTEEDEDLLRNAFDTILGEITKILPNVNQTRWCKKTDFYSLFLVLYNHIESLPLSKENRIKAGALLIDFGNKLKKYLSVSKEENDKFSSEVETYGKGVRASTDASSRKSRNTALENILKDIWE